MAVVFTREVAGLNFPQWASYRDPSGVKRYIVGERIIKDCEAIPASRLSLVCFSDSRRTSLIYKPNDRARETDCPSNRKGFCRRFRFRSSWRRRHPFSVGIWQAD